MQPESNPASTVKSPRRAGATIKLLLIASLVVLLHVPLVLLGSLRVQRVRDHQRALTELTQRGQENHPLVEGYRMVDRSLKYAALVLILVFSAFFLFETLIGVRLHIIHYTLVGAALCLFYLALLALGEVWMPGRAYVGAATASSLLIVTYSASILRSWARAVVIAALLVIVHGTLYVVLRMEDFALLAGTATLFGALGAVMYFTRNVDWGSSDPATSPIPSTSTRPEPSPTPSAGT